MAQEALQRLSKVHSIFDAIALELIMAKLNHSNIAMTERYLDIKDDELRAIAEGLNL